MTQKGAKVAELFKKVIATTKCFDHNLRKVTKHHYVSTQNIRKVKVLRL